MSKERLLIETLLRIPDKDGNDVDFVLNEEQALFDANMTGRDIIPKARQLGFSTYVLARHFVRCMAYRNRKCVIMSHSVDATQKLLARIHYMIKHIKCPPPVLKHNTQSFITFEKTDSSIFIGTAGSGDYGVGDTITDLHCSEVSRWQNPQSLLKGLFQAVPRSGIITIESTGKGVGNWFHQQTMRSAGGDSAYRLHFFNWLNRPEYQDDLTPEEEARILANLDESLEEPRYLAMGLTARHLSWRRRKLEEMNFSLRDFREEYPVTLEECFQAKGAGYFHKVNHVESPDWVREDPWSYTHSQHPRKGLSYVMGIDSAGGVGQDSSVIEVFCLETGEQVYEFANNMIQFRPFAQKAVDVARRFNMAYINPERNNHGFVVIDHLLALDYPRNKIHRGKTSRPTSGPAQELRRISDFGTFTSDITKALAVSRLRDKLAGEWTIYSQPLNLECASFVEKDTGKLEAEDGCHDDRVMASAMAAFVAPRAANEAVREAEIEREQNQRENSNPFAFENLEKELVSRYRGPETTGDYPISSGLELL